MEQVLEDYTLIQKTCSYGAIVKLYTYKEVAEILRVSERTVWDLVKKGKLKACRIAGRSIRITDDALREFVSQAEIA